MKGQEMLNILPKYLLALYLLILPSHTFAYIDPGTGNMAIQILLALFAGGLYVLYRFRDSLKNLIARLFLAISKMFHGKCNSK